jgi:cytochrome c oxidase cbb3-type subunit III
MGRFSVVKSKGAAFWALALAAVLRCGAPAYSEAAIPDEHAAGSAKPAAVAGPDFPRPPGDPAAIARGKQVFSVNCAFCHGSDARGGEGGPNLLRSPIVLNDQHGELVAAIVSTGRVAKGMPKFDLPMESISDIAAYLHSINVGRNATAPFDPRSVLVGNAAAGKKYFNGEGHCTACHSVNKDLAGIASKFSPKDLQDAIFTGGSTGMLGMPSPTAPPRSVTAKMPGGEVIQGRLVYVDDFVVVLIDANGKRCTLRRDGNNPELQITDPMQWHLDMARRWEDRDLHDLTAYLATLK